LDKWDRQIRKSTPGGDLFVLKEKKGDENKRISLKGNLDVCDDFRSERRQVLKVNGKSYPFSYGDYVVKCLIGCIDPSLDKQDEAKSSKEKCLVS